MQDEGSRKGPEACQSVTDCADQSQELDQESDEATAARTLVLGNLGEIARELIRCYTKKSLSGHKEGTLESVTRPLMPRGCGIRAVVAGTARKAQKREKNEKWKRHFDRNESSLHLQPKARFLRACTRAAYIES